MIHRRFARIVRLASAFAALAAVGAPPAHAAITAIRAQTSAAVQELIDGAFASLSEDAGSVAGPDDAFPATAQTRLISSDLDDKVISFGSAFGEVADPTRTGRENPEEFGAEVGCWSDSPAIAYEVSSDAREERDLVFSTSPEVDPFPIDFGDGGTRTVQSSVFFGGAMIFWSRDGGPGLKPLNGQLALSVTRDDTGEKLVDIRIAVDGAEGAPALEGKVDVKVGGLELLADGADEETLAALEAFEAAGDVRVVLVPFQTQPYTFAVKADDPFTLQAELSALVTNAPAGSGAAAAWGRDFAALGDLLDQALPDVNGKLIEKAINRAARADGTEDALRPAGRGLCGAMGAMVFLLPIALMGLAWHGLPARERATGFQPVISGRRPETPIAGGKRQRRPR